MDSVLLDSDEILQHTLAVLNRVGCPTKAHQIIVFSLASAVSVVDRAIEKARKEIH